MEEREIGKQVQNEIFDWKMSQNHANWQADRKGKAVFGLLYLDGDSHAPWVVRVGLLVLGILFLLFAVFLTVLPFRSEFEAASTLPWIVALFFYLFAGVAIHNAFLRRNSKKGRE